MDKAHGLTTGIPLGYFSDEKNGVQQWRKLSYKEDRHLILIAPTRTGKGTTVIVPTLLEYDASCFVTDPKGELAAVTARHRRDRMGHEVFILNPFGVLQKEFEARGFPKSHCFNPLALLDPKSTSFMADVARLGEALIYHEGKEPQRPRTSALLDVLHPSRQLADIDRRAGRQFLVKLMHGGVL